MNTNIWVIDAFTSVPFKGNPAAVCMLDAFPDDSVLKNIAMEINLAETAFLVPISPQEYHLRWFTPATEVLLCGHATLAATHFLLESGIIKPQNTVAYHTLSGKLQARGLDSVIELDFPELPGVAVTPHTALDTLSVEIMACERNRDNYLVEVEDYKTLLACRPDYGALLALDKQGVIITTATGVPEGYDFASRYFAPSAGVDEDPVTGSAHCFLAPYWAKKLNKSAFTAYQASKRGGILGVALEHGRVKIEGSAVTTLKGQLQIQIVEEKEKAA